MPAHLYESSLNEMERALEVMAELVPPPRTVPFKQSFVYRYVEQMSQQAIIQKLARLLSSLRAAHLLLEAGLYQEQSTLQRLIDEIVEDVIFLSLPLIYGGERSRQDAYLQAFFEEEFDPKTGLPTAQDRPMVPRKKIRSYIAQSPLGGQDPSGHIDVSRTISKVYSGYVHAASPQIMDMYGGYPPRFYTAGMLGTPREADHRQDIVNYDYRSITSFAIAARALNHEPLFKHLFSLCNEYEEAMGVR